MATIYSKPSPGNDKANSRTPKQETIDFLLNFSKAFKCYNYKAMECEILLN